MILFPVKGPIISKLFLIIIIIIIIIIIKDEDGCNESNWCVIPLTPFTVSLRTEPRGGHVSGTQRPRRLVMDTFDGSLPQLPFSLSLLSLSLSIIPASCCQIPALLVRLSRPLFFSFKFYIYIYTPHSLLSSLSL